MTVYNLKSPGGHALDGYFREAMQLNNAGQLEEAKDVLQRILSLKPDFDNARLALALNSFLREDWTNAWEQYEWRLQTHDLMPKPPPDERGRQMVESINQKRWHHGPVPKDLLIFTEQGLGDVIHFCRFIPQLVRGGSEVTLITEEKMFDLLKTLSAPPRLQPKTQRIHIGPHTRWVPLMSLARALDLVSPQQFVPEMPYLRAEPARVAMWRQILGTKGIKIGICWQGNPQYNADQGRSMPIEALAPLAALPQVRLISLQKDVLPEQLAGVSFRERIELLGSEFDAGPSAFLDSAAVMMNLDLVVSVDTSVSHLAGALGRPQFLLLKKIGADWRWLSRRSDTVWYPRAKLFRQTVDGDWFDVGRRVADAVLHITAGRTIFAA